MVTAKRVDRFAKYEEKTMDSDRFDALTRSLGQRRDRRSVVRSFGAAAIGAVGLIGLKGVASAEPGAKVGICHRTGSESNPYEYITVSVNAVPAHEAHGDTVTDLTDVGNCGACGNICTAPENATAYCGEIGCGFTCNGGYELDETGTGCVAVNVSQCTQYSFEEPVCFWLGYDYSAGEWCWEPTGIGDQQSCEDANECAIPGGACYMWSTHS